MEIVVVVVVAVIVVVSVAVIAVVIVVVVEQEKSVFIQQGLYKLRLTHPLFLGFARAS